MLGESRTSDVRPVYVSADVDGGTDQRVAAYVAKYATKGAESAGTVDRPIRRAEDSAGLAVTEHARRMILTCFALGRLPEYRDLPLRQWAHMLGYRGHFSTKSRRYSISLGDLRQARADHRAGQARSILGLPAPDREEERRGSPCPSGATPETACGTGKPCGLNSPGNASPPSAGSPVNASRRFLLRADEFSIRLA
ncbi:replication initiator [Streptosporangium canum]|uniref:replication initiator n=1 Tax=Streptosporangium canum TaxID=324952 RepID=UPI00341CBFCB